MSPIKSVIHEIGEDLRQSLWIPLLTVYAVLSSIIGPGVHISLFHIPFIVIGLFLVLKSSLKIEITALLLILYLPLNIILTQPDAVFNSWQRLALFSVVFLLTSPILKGYFISIYRKKLLFGMLVLCVLLGIGSFVCYFLGINYMGNQFDGSAINDYQGSAGGFGGLLNQSIALGFISGIGIMYMLYHALFCTQKDRKWYYLAIILLLITILISASRAALISTLAGGIILLYQFSNKKKGLFIKALMGCVLAVLLTYPIWSLFTTGLETKNESYAELGAFGSRSQKWAARIIEFTSSPIFGIGYASVDNNFDEVGMGGVVEPGSSWLAILSMTGIIGFILFIAILRKPFQYLKSHPTPYNALLMGLLAFICTHMISEGYIFAGGSSLCFIAWLIFGCCNDARYTVD